VELIDRPDHPIVLVQRKFAPLGWAIPGGFVDYGETVEQAAVREAKEEISLDINLVEQFQVYSHPQRDDRQHTISIVFIAEAGGEPLAADDALSVGIFRTWELPKNLCFDHDLILRDYLTYRYHRLRPPIRL
jgi:8-oxo-dGTP diphosphatase